MGQSSAGLTGSRPMRRRGRNIPPAGAAMLSPRVRVFPSPKELGPALGTFVVGAASQAVQSRGRFAVAVSGGGLVPLLAAELPAALERESRMPGADSQRWILGFCDERLVPFDDPQSTCGLYRKQLFSKISIPNNQVVAINPSLPVDEAADKYAEKLRELFPGENIPVFDLLLLGIGPDGHTCSLFPDHPLLQEQSKIIAPISDSPKPPPKRITMTLPLLNAARNAVFVVTGESKASILKDILEGHQKNPLPAARIKLAKGEVHWFIDEAAASKLTMKVERVHK
ncbi:6-phosphogluconolactonase [Amblyraja radiata]|uniref:6-phosphogluconolactonase n=1 Tax=Amblyraja radiata TaxID=386614 RepID=UPI00140319ED|nr:6-phosphogluconolactonase [Amblyraja radiata]